jgi:hypothetical protein
MNGRRSRGERFSFNADVDEYARQAQEAGNRWILPDNLRVMSRAGWFVWWMSREWYQRLAAEAADELYRLNQLCEKYDIDINEDLDAL